MMKNSFRQLILRTIQAPAEATTQALALGLASRTVWMLLVLLTISGSLAASTALLLLPSPDPQLHALVQQMLAYQAPLIFAAFQLVQAVIGVFTLYHTGRLLGGSAQPADLALGFVLIQVTAFVLGIGLILIAILIPAASRFGFIALVIWSIWASVAMINSAHQFNNMAKSVLALLAAGVVIFIFGLVITAMFGAAATNGV